MLRSKRIAVWTAAAMSGLLLVALPTFLAQAIGVSPLLVTLLTPNPDVSTNVEVNVFQANAFPSSGWGVDVSIDQQGNSVLVELVGVPPTGIVSPAFMPLDVDIQLGSFAPGFYEVDFVFSQGGQATLFLCVAPAACTPQTAFFEPSRDTSIYEENGAEAGATGSLFVGRTGSMPGASNDQRRGLVHFDLGSIPAGSMVLESELEMSLMLVPTDNIAQSVTLRRITSDWGTANSFASGRGGPAQAGDATWTHRFFPDIPWAAAGGDLAAASSAVRTVNGAGRYEWSGVTVNADVQGWVDDTASNFGWMAISQSTNQQARTFGSSEANDPASRPVLRVEYIPELGSMYAAICGIATLALLWFWRLPEPARRR